MFELKIDPEPIDMDPYVDHLEVSDMYTIIKPLSLTLPKEYQLETTVGDCFRTYRGSNTIEVQIGYVWDGASVVLNTSTAILPSLIHDIVCTTAAGPEGPVKPLSGYLERHLCYYDIGRLQRMGRLRLALHTLGLVLFNWLYDLLKGNE